MIVCNAFHIESYRHRGPLAWPFTVKICQQSFAIFRREYCLRKFGLATLTFAAFVPQASLRGNTAIYESHNISACIRYGVGFQLRRYDAFASAPTLFVTISYLTRYIGIEDYHVDVWNSKLLGICWLARVLDHWVGVMSQCTWPLPI